MLLEKWRVNSRVIPACFTSLLCGNKTSLYWQNRSRIWSICDCPKAESKVELIWQQGLPPGLFSAGDGLGEPFGRVLVTAPPCWVETVYLGRLLSLSAIFWNESTPSSYMQPHLFIKPSCRDAYCSSPFVSIKIGKFHVITEGCLHITYGPLKFVSSHTQHTLCLNCLFWLALIYLKKIPFSSLGFGCVFCFLFNFMPWYFRNSWVVFEGSFMLRQV